MNTALVSMAVNSSVWTQIQFCVYGCKSDKMASLRQVTGEINWTLIPPMKDGWQQLTRCSQVRLSTGKVMCSFNFFLEALSIKTTSIVYSECINSVLQGIHNALRYSISIVLTHYRCNLWWTIENFNFKDLESWMLPWLVINWWGLIYIMTTLQCKKKKRVHTAHVVSSKCP